MNLFWRVLLACLPGAQIIIGNFIMMNKSIRNQCFNVAAESPRGNRLGHKHLFAKIKAAQRTGSKGSNTTKMLQGTTAGITIPTSHNHPERRNIK